MHDVHVNVFAKDGSWKPNDWFTQPAGLQRLTVSGKTDWFPSWYSKVSGLKEEKILFDKISKKKATDCTPASARIEIALQYTTDPVTERKTYISTDGYLPNETDDVHKCTDQRPFINSVEIGSNGKVTVNVTQGTHPLSTITLTINGATVGMIQATHSGNHSITLSNVPNGTYTVTAVATDSALYSSTPVSDSN